ncbi:hypothetical protein PG990_011914 [Apiospora arundinis]
MSQAKPSWASLLQPPPSSSTLSTSEPPATNNTAAANANVPEVNSNVQFPTRTSAATAISPRGVAMISGHMDLSPEEFARGYHTQLDNAISNGDSFVMGDAKGVDETALAYILAKDASAASRITVYASRPANVARLEQLGVKVVLYDMRQPAAAGAVPSRGRGRGRGGGRGAGRQVHLQRDATMTENSTYDILYVRTEAESRALYGDKYRPRVSATELNRQRRAQKLTTQGGNS